MRLLHASSLRSGRPWPKHMVKPWHRTRCIPRGRPWTMQVDNTSVWLANLDCHWIFQRRLSSIPKGLHVWHFHTWNLQICCGFSYEATHGFFLVDATNLVLLTYCNRFGMLTNWSTVTTLSSNTARKGWNTLFPWLFMGTGGEHRKNNPSRSLVCSPWSASTLQLAGPAHAAIAMSVWCMVAQIFQIHWCIFSTTSTVHSLRTSWFSPTLRRSTVRTSQIYSMVWWKPYCQILVKHVKQGSM